RSLAGEANRPAFGAVRAGDDSEREIAGLEHRALLDVQLDAADRILEPVARLEHRVELHPVRGHGVRRAHTLGVAKLTQAFRVERAGRRGRADQALPEARA